MTEAQSSVPKRSTTRCLKGALIPTKNNLNKDKMSGRGGRGGRGQTRPSQGRGGRFSSTTLSKTSSTKKSLSDYNFYLGSAKQASDYETTREYLINTIRKNYTNGNDIAMALEDLTQYNVGQYKPTLQFSTTADEDQKKAENEAYKMEFKAKLDLYMRRKSTYENNLTKAYAFIWEQCAKAMQNKIESRTDYATIKNDPIALLGAIKQHALNYQEN